MRGQDCPARLPIRQDTGALGEDLQGVLISGDCVTPFCIPVARGKIEPRIAEIVLRVRPFQRGARSFVTTVSAFLKALIDLLRFTPLSPVGKSSHATPRLFCAWAGIGWIGLWRKP